ncbi:MAG: lysylphosphatidylglycerol synthase transmembrane domain-containing protein [Balneolaceae bacterium]
MTKTATNNGNGTSLISVKYIVISIGLSMLSMGIVFYLTYTPGVFDHLAPKRLPGLFIAIGVMLLKVCFTAAKQRVLSDRELSWPASFRIALTWDFASAVTPSTIGGSPAATYAMTREGIKLGKASAIVLYGVLLDQFWYALAVPILILAGFYFEVLPPEIGLVGNLTMVFIYTSLLLFGGFLTYGLMVNPSAFKKFVNRIFRWPYLNRYADKVNAEAEHLEDHSYQLRDKPLSFYLKAFFYSTMSWLCKVALPVIVILSLLPANEILLVLRSLAMNLAFLVIPTPGGSGGVEGLFVLFLGPLIERTSFIGLAVFAWRIITYYISIGVGIFATMWYVNHKVSEIKEKNSSAAA